MNRRLFIVMISIIVVAFLLTAANPMLDEKPMVSFTATETCKMTSEGVTKYNDTIKMVKDAKWVCNDSSNDPLANGAVTLKLLDSVSNTKQNMAGYALYSFTLKNDLGSWNGYRIARTNKDGVTFTNAFGWGTGDMGDRPHMRGWQIYYKMTDASPSVITGKYFE